MCAIFALSRAQLLLLVITRSRDLSRECTVIKHKTPARSTFPLFNFGNSGTIQFSSSISTRRGLCPKNFEKRAHLIGPLGCALFSKFLRQNPLLIELGELNRMVPIFVKLDSGKLLLADVLCLVP